MEELREKVDNLLHRDLQLEGVMTRLNLLNNKIILTGEVSKEDLDKVNLVLEPFSGRIENLLGEKQERGTIEIEVELIELQTGATKSLGISLPGALSIGEAESSFLGGEGITEPRTSSTALFNVLGYSRTALGATMDFLIQEGKARILSKPRLACQSGKEAELMVGGEKPIMTTTVGEGGGEGTNVSYKSYGIQLKIAPEIVENRRRIHLNLDFFSAIFLALTRSPQGILNNFTFNPYSLARLLIISGVLSVELSITIYSSTRSFIDNNEGSIQSSSLYVHTIADIPSSLEVEVAGGIRRR